uniref:Uncharacterized protein n=1 Tax=Medicago truncatula TaxID=3880 RepID=I3S0V8_MEDTR|nr:unknown [Medicago truncatula]
MEGLVVLRLELELLWSMVHSNQLKMVLLKMITVGTKRQICYTWNRLLVLVSPILQMNHSTTP